MALDLKRGQNSVTGVGPVLGRPVLGRPARGLALSRGTEALPKSQPGREEE